MALIAGPIITQPPFAEPDCHDHFQPIFQHNHLCRASLEQSDLAAALPTDAREPSNLSSYVQAGPSGSLITAKASIGSINPTLAFATHDLSKAA